MTCHNGTTATGKPTTHVPTTQACDICHRTSAWLPASFSHTGVAPGTCATCHNGTTARGKPTTHHRDFYVDAKGEVEYGLVDQVLAMPEKTKEKAKS